MLKPIWTYGIQLWGPASTSNIEILDRFQSQALRMIVDSPWYVLNTVIRRNLQAQSVKRKIRCYSSQYNARLSAHANDLEVTSRRNQTKTVDCEDTYQMICLPVS
jgi:hypothetical protein